MLRTLLNTATFAVIAIVVATGGESRAAQPDQAPLYQQRDYDQRHQDHDVYRDRDGRYYDRRHDDDRRRYDRRVEVPPGHLPPPGECRIWFFDRPPGQQPPPGDCRRLSRLVPRGATLVWG